jgi:hypothetical protein
MAIGPITKEVTIPSEVDASHTPRDVYPKVNLDYGAVAAIGSSNGKDPKMTSSNLKQKHKKAFEMAEGPHCKPRDPSPLCTHDSNVQRSKKNQIVFNYQANEYQLALPKRTELTPAVISGSYENSASSTVGSSVYTHGSTIGKIVNAKVVAFGQ